MSMVEKGLLQTPELYQYVLDTSVYPREAEALRELRAMNADHPCGLMATAPDAAQLISMLLNLLNAKKTIEIGVLTGYSLLLTALNIPDDGKVIAIDRDREAYEYGLPVIKRAGVEHKITFVEADAMQALDHLLEDSSNIESFDYAFVDADKVRYKEYHEKLLQLIKVGGIIVYDNTLWGGSVVMPEESVIDWMKPGRLCTIDFNAFLAADHRIHISHVPVGDGITICKRLK